jgi:hypothetical protein
MTGEINNLRYSIGIKVQEWIWNKEEHFVDLIQSTGSQGKIQLNEYVDGNNVIIFKKGYEKYLNDILIHVQVEYHHFLTSSIQFRLGATRLLSCCSWKYSYLHWHQYAPNEVVDRNVKTWLWNRVDFFRDSFTKPVYRWPKCIQLFGDCMEK